MKMKKQKPTTVPSGTLPATYVNHAHVAWSDGVVRLTFGEEGLGPTPLVRAAVALSTGTAVGLVRVLQQALDAMSPPVASGSPVIFEDIPFTPPAPAANGDPTLMAMLDDAEIVHHTDEKLAVKA